MKKTLLPILTLIIVLLLCSCGTEAKITGSDEYISFVEKLNEGKIDIALTLYSNLTPEEITKANNTLKEHIGEIEEKYNNGTYDFSTSKILLEKYLQFSTVTDLATSTLNYITKDNDEMIALTKGKMMYENCKFADAIDTLSSISAISKYHTDATELLEKSISAFRNQITTEAGALIENGDYKGANDKFEYALTVLSNDTVIVEMKNAMFLKYDDKLLSEADALVQNGDLNGAIKLLSESFSVSETVKSKLNEYKNTRSDRLIAAALAEAQVLADKKDWEGAVKRLEEANASAIIYEKGKITAKIDEYKAKYPKKLTVLNSTSDESSSKVKYHEDLYGNYYDDVIEFTRFHNGTKQATYIVNNQFTTFETTVFAHTDTTKDCWFTFKIYCDDVLVNVQNSILFSSLPCKISANITGCVKLRIEIEFKYSKDSPVDGANMYVDIGNPIVSNK